MLSLGEFLVESEVNAHMQHIEDRVWDSGVNGVRQAINYFQNLRDQLAGNAKNAINISVKFDGSPSVFAGIDPTDGKFFVAKKGIFNKNPKIYKTPAEIDADTEGDLNYKLKLALEHFPKLGITGIIQGDFLYAKKDLKLVTIGNESYVTFHPNTIVYAIPEKSKLAQKILRSEVGVVWHTVYTGSNFESLKAHFGRKIAGSLKKVGSVFAVDAVFEDVSGSASMTAQETLEVTALLSKIGKLFNQIPKSAFDLFAQHSELNIKLNTFINNKIRAGSRITEPAVFAHELKMFITTYYQNEADKKKSDKGKASSFAKKDELISALYSIDETTLIAMVNLYNLMIDVKLLFVSKLNKASKLSTFLLTNKGFVATNEEGFVAMDHLGKNAVKLVDRLQFSWANFSPEIKKGWQR